MLYGCAKAPQAPPSSSAASPLLSGIEIRYFDGSVRPQDDFYKHINGKWLAETEIPADKGSYGTFAKLRDDSEAKLHTIIDGLQKSVDPSDPDQQKIADLYFSFMDEPTLESLGIKPLDAEFAKVDALKDKKEIGRPDRTFQRNRSDGTLLPRSCTRTPRIRPNMCSISSKMALGCRTAITTC